MYAILFLKSAKRLQYLDAISALQMCGAVLSALNGRLSIKPQKVDVIKHTIGTLFSQW